jgi:hypothetical protein
MGTSVALALVAALVLNGCNNHDNDPWIPVVGSDFGGRVVTEDNEDTYYDRSQSSPESSAGVYVGSNFVVFGGLLTLSVLLYWMHRRRAKLEEGFNPNAPLQDGAAVVFGRVETEDRGPAVRLEIAQAGREWQYKGAWNHAWEESARQQQQRSFVIRTATGVAVRVDPPQGVKVHGEIDQSVRHDHAHRTQVLEVKHGDEVHVYGALSGAHQQSANAYRAAATMPVLSAASFAPMVISREKPGETPRKRAGVFRNLAIASLVWIVFAVSVVFHSYTVLALTGDVVPATIEATRTWREWVKPKNSPGYWRHHYEIRATANGRPVTDEVSYSLFQQAQGGSVRTVPFLVSTLDAEYHQFGSQPHTGGGRLAISVLAALLWMILYPVFALTSRPWYSKKKLKQGGAGTIADGDARDAKATKR